MRRTPNYVGHIPDFMCAPLFQNQSNKFVGLLRHRCKHIENLENGRCVNQCLDSFCKHVRFPSTCKMKNYKQIRSLFQMSSMCSMNTSISDFHTIINVIHFVASLCKLFSQLCWSKEDLCKTPQSVKFCEVTVKFP